MQYLLTQEELDALKRPTDVDKKVEERVLRIVRAMEQVMRNYGSFDPMQHQMLTELRATLRTE